NTVSVGRFRSARKSLESRVDLRIETREVKSVDWMSVGEEKKNSRRTVREVRRRESPAPPAVRIYPARSGVVSEGMVVRRRRWEKYAGCVMMKRSCCSFVIAASNSGIEGAIFCNTVNA